jgi:steroid 5-alpha reductase family enzyme
VIVLELTAAVLAAMALVMTVGWLTQRAVGDGGWTDVFWVYGVGATCALAALAPFETEPHAAWRRIMVAAMVGAWALRLGTYLALRVAGAEAEDQRYAVFRREWGANFQRRMYGLMIVQAPVGAVLGLCVMIAARENTPAFRLQDAIGLAVFVTCLAGESLADAQMRAFRADPANRGKVCDRGLWAWSRHPNYFFEAAIWLAYPIIAIDPNGPRSFVSILAPVMMYLVVRRASGVPPLEEAMLRSRGEAYRRYQERVSVLIPWPPRRERLGAPPARR